MENEKIATGAYESPFDPRTIKHEEMVQGGAPLQSGGVDYSPEEIEHQHSVGICTAISRVQLREKQTGKKYSPDFQYLLQKRFYDKTQSGSTNWNEGSAIFWAMKVAKNQGFLPLELFPHVTENDRYLPYSQYIAKLQAIPESEIQRLLLLCVDKIAGYAFVDCSDPQKIATAIANSPAQSGILCRYDCGSTWWVPSWSPHDINPLRKPIPATSGHAIIMSNFHYGDTFMQKLANTWGKLWCLLGSADINWSNYAPTEAWVDTAETPVIAHKFYMTLKLGMHNDEVKALQRILGITEDGWFGKTTFENVQTFQKIHGLKVDGVVGPLTNAVLNKL